LFHQFARQAGRDQLGEQGHETALQHAALERHARELLAEQMAGGKRAQCGVTLRGDGHFGDQPHTQPQFDIGLEHVGIERFEHDLWLQVGMGEGGIDLAASGKGGLVGHQRIGG